MVVFDATMNFAKTSLIIFPQAGPDVKYFLGFVRTQLSTTTTVVLVFAPKVLRVLRGQGDQLDHRARVRGITASFSMNGIGLVPEDSPDLYQENEELKVRLNFIRFAYVARLTHFENLIRFEIDWHCTRDTERERERRPSIFFLLIFIFACHLHVFVLFIYFVRCFSANPDSKIVVTPNGQIGGSSKVSGTN